MSPLGVFAALSKAITNSGRHPQSAMYRHIAIAIPCIDRPAKGRALSSRVKVYADFSARSKDEYRYTLFESREYTSSRKAASRAGM